MLIWAQGYIPGDQQPVLVHLLSLSKMCLLAWFTHWYGFKWWENSMTENILDWLVFLSLCLPTPYHTHVEGIGCHSQRTLRPYLYPSLRVQKWDRKQWGSYSCVALPPTYSWHLFSWHLVLSVLPWPGRKYIGFWPPEKSKLKKIPPYLCSSLIPGRFKTTCLWTKSTFSVFLNCVCCNSLNF